MFDGGAAAVGAEDVARHRDELRTLGALTARSSLDSVNINLTQKPMKIAHINCNRIHNTGVGLTLSWGLIAMLLHLVLEDWVLLLLGAILMLRFYQYYENHKFEFQFSCGRDNKL